MPPADGARLFAPLAADYAAARPGYPTAVFRMLRSRLAPGTGGRMPLVVDVAAGTGMAARGLLAAGLRVAAIDPAPEMLREGERALRGRPGWTGAVTARAEALPLGAACVPAIVVAQAFHWLEPHLALDEFARVLEPGGTLLVLWNVTQPDDFTGDVWSLVERHNQGRKRPVTPQMQESPDPLKYHPRFAVDPPALMEHERSLTREEYLAYARSWSYVGGALSRRRMARFESELLEVLGRHAREGSVVERFLTAMHFARRL